MGTGPFVGRAISLCPDRTASNCYLSAGHAAFSPSTGEPRWPGEPRRPHLQQQDVTGNAELARSRAPRGDRARA